MPPLALTSSGEVLAAIAEEVQADHQTADIAVCERVLEEDSRERFRYLLRSERTLLHRADLRVDSTMSGVKRGRSYLRPWKVRERVVECRGGTSRLG